VELFDAAGDLRTRRGLLRFQGALRGLAFLPPAGGTPPELAAAAGMTVPLWETEPPRKRLVLKGHEAEVRCVAAVRGGRVLSGGGDGTVRLWDAGDGRELARYAWEIGPVNAVTAAADGMTAAAAGDEPRIMVWDLD
jgi:WD40 repeat protein